MRTDATGEQRRGFVLILVLVVIALTALSAYTFTDLMVTEQEGVLLRGRQIQAKRLVESGVTHARYLLELTPLDHQDLGGLYDNSQLFQAQLVTDHLAAAARGRFSIVAPAYDELGIPQGVRFGLQDESCRLNLNSLDVKSGQEENEVEEQAADEPPENGDADAQEPPPEGNAQQDNNPGQPAEKDPDQQEKDDEEDVYDFVEEDDSARAILMRLPGMTEDVAAAILDWIDEDDQPRESGAEIDYYSSLPIPYAPRNGPLESIDELLLVRGVTPDLLYGRDVNRNGMVDASERNRPLAIAADQLPGTTDLGWAAYLTIHASERNTNSLGQPRINLNNDDLQALHDELVAVLDPNWVTFIVAFRQNGPSDNGKAKGQQEGDEGDAQEDEEEGEEVSGQELDLTRPGRVPIRQVLDLIDVNVQTQLASGDTVTLKSPFRSDAGAAAEYLPKLLDYCTVIEEERFSGRININRASRVVLDAIPGMTPDLVDAIISQRDPYDDNVESEQQTVAWLLTRGIVTLDELRQLMPYITTRGHVYRCQVVGYFDKQEISARASVIIDATQSYPRVVSWNDYSHLERGFPRTLLGIELDTSAAASSSPPLQ